MDLTFLLSSPAFTNRGNPLFPSIFFFFFFASLCFSLICYVRQFNNLWRFVVQRSVEFRYCATLIESISLLQQKETNACVGKKLYKW